jgi:hypothetical protein
MPRLFQANTTYSLPVAGIVELSFLQELFNNNPEKSSNNKIFVFIGEANVLVLSKLERNTIGFIIPVKYSSLWNCKHNS